MAEKGLEAGVPILGNSIIGIETRKIILLRPDSSYFTRRSHLPILCTESRRCLFAKRERASNHLGLMHSVKALPILILKFNENVNSLTSSGVARIAE